MTRAELFDKAYNLCVKCNSHAIAHDLHLMTEGELMGVINFLVQLQAN